MSEQSPAGRRDREYRVTFTGVPLPDDLAADIDKEIHRVVLLHLAELDTMTGCAVRFVRGRSANDSTDSLAAASGSGGGGTQGMHIIADAEVTRDG